ncbi:MAG: DNA polymerase III subunit beta [Nitrospinota bacterium]|nr:DNA polymerase III subunit beta [Nitrospinota bacterium]MDH5679384.1 DNA polymerase III subunit beta [Nitrospinota bacterium]MDH5757627.1 DNA polymerase III subunit beta [Nitrospinota bacterium]
MEFTIERGQFQRALQRAHSVASSKGPMPILSNVLLEAKDGSVSVYATNLDMGLKGRFKAKVTTPGKTTVLAKKLHDIVRELPEGDVVVKLDDDARCRIILGKSKFNLATIDPADFPAFPSYDSASLTPLDGEMLSEMIRKTSFAISQDETRMTLNGALMEVSATKVRMVATDGHRLAFIEREGAFKVKNPEKTIITKKAIAELSKLQAEGEEDEVLKFHRHDNHIIFEKGAQVLAIRLIEGAYPNYEQVIPKEFSGEAKLPVAEFIHALRRVVQLADEKSHMIRFTFTEGKVELLSEGGEIGEARDEMAIEYSGQEFVVGLNAYYLLDILNIIGHQEVVLRLQNQLSPVMVKSPDDPGLICIVMPMRL